MRRFASFISESSKPPRPKRLSKASLEELAYRLDGLETKEERDEFESFMANPLIDRLRSHPKVLWHLKDLLALHKGETDPLNRRAYKAISKDLEGVG